MNILSVIAILSVGSLLVHADYDPLYAPGRSTMVHLFEWKWKDIANECETFLAPNGYAGVQVSPPNEHAVISASNWPWWQRYQPVSYSLVSRSGSDTDFADMVSRCNAVGVRIYVDAVINHMAAGSGIGSQGNHFSYEQFPFFSAFDFNDRSCTSPSGNIEDFTNLNQRMFCKLVGLPDLNSSTEYVRGQIVGYLNHLIDIGVAGFRVDAAGHIWPYNLATLYGRLKNVRSDVFGDNKRAYIFQEVVDTGALPSNLGVANFTALASLIEFKYGSYLSDVVLKRYNHHLNDLRTFGTQWGMVDSGNALVFLCNHDTERTTPNGPLTFNDKRNYLIGSSFMLAWPYGNAQVLSSYYYNSYDQGPPTDGQGTTKDVTINSDGTCGNGWVCEHRWPQVANMAILRNVAAGQPVSNWWDNSGNQIAFGRGNQAFVALNMENFDMNVNLQTGMPAGQYCDVISGNINNGTNSCTGNTITVQSSGMANIVIQSSSSVPVIAFHSQSKLRAI